jgi:hypothetical protein
MEVTCSNSAGTLACGVSAKSKNKVYCMPSKIFDTLLTEQIEIFKNSFINTSKIVFYDENDKKLIHPGEFGHYREAVCRKFLRYFIPQHLEIENGFIINTNDEVSTECDLVVYDKGSTPLIQSAEMQRFYPVETVAAVGEVKSNLSKAGLKEALRKLSKVKSMREKVLQPVIMKKSGQGEFNPLLNPKDQIFTFLICQKFDFDTTNLAVTVNNIYDRDIQAHHRHNLILSIEDGLIAYYKEKVDQPHLMIYYPIFYAKPVKTAISLPNMVGYDHIKGFATFMFSGTSNSTILYPDMALYIFSRFNEANFAV